MKLKFFLLSFATLFLTHSFSAMATFQDGLGELDIRWLSTGSVLPAPSFTRSGQLALTFDDGPTPGTTEAVLKVLAKHKVTATFFLLGKNVTAYPAIAQKVVSGGHMVGNHSLMHKSFSQLMNSTASQAQKRELIYTHFTKAHNVLTPYQGNNDRLYFRAPYGAWASSAAKIVNSFDAYEDYVGPIFWNIGGQVTYGANSALTGAADWDCWSKGFTASRCAQGYVAETKRIGGGVVLMHDINAKTAQMLDLYIAAMKAQGYDFVGLDEVDFPVAPRVR